VGKEREAEGGQCPAHAKWKTMSRGRAETDQHEKAATQEKPSRVLTNIFQETNRVWSQLNCRDNYYGGSRQQQKTKKGSHLRTSSLVA